MAPPDLIRQDCCSSHSNLDLNKKRDSDTVFILCTAARNMFLGVFAIGPGRPSAGGARWDRCSNTVLHASLRACGAQLGGSVWIWKQGKWQNPLKLRTYQPSNLPALTTFVKQPSNLFQKCLETWETTISLEYGKCLETGETKSLANNYLFKGFCRFPVSRHFWMRKVSGSRRNDKMLWIWQGWGHQILKVSKTGEMTKSLE